MAQQPRVEERHVTGDSERDFARRRRESRIQPAERTRVGKRIGYQRHLQVRVLVGRVRHEDQFVTNQRQRIAHALNEHHAAERHERLILPHAS